MQKTYFLDDDNNIVESDKATHTIIQELDDNGNLIREVFGYTKIPQKEVEDDGFLDKEPSPAIQKVLDDYVDLDGSHPFRKQ